MGAPSPQSGVGMTPAMPSQSALTFDAIYEITSGDDDGGYRRFSASDLQDAKSALRSALTAEGRGYVLHALRETDESFAARRSVAA